MDSFPAIELTDIESADRSRGNMIGCALWLTDWLRSQRFPFTTGHLARGMETSYRTALRWLEVAEGIGLVECDRSRATWRLASIDPEMTVSLPSWCASGGFRYSFAGVIFWPARRGISAGWPV